MKRKGESSLRINRTRFRGLLLLLVLSTAVSGPIVVSAVAAPAYANGPTITGAGSSYASVAIDQWVAEISSIDGDSVNYSVSSSVIGLNEFAQQQVSFGASEIGYSTGQANQTPPAGYAYQYLPDVAGATCMMFNLDSPITSQQITSLDLTTSMILGIFTGTITTWGQLAVNGLNSELAGDSSPITTVFRTDASGENYILSDYLNTIDPAAWAKYTSTLNFPGGPQAIWPFPQGGGSHPGYNFSNWNGEVGSDQASEYVYSNPGSITYVETAYAIAHHDPCASVQNLPGDAFVQPSALADAEALLHAELEPDLEQLLTGVFTTRDPKAYAISAYSYLVTPEHQMNPAQGAVLGQFVEFLACQGQQSAEQLGYSPLPPNLVNDDFQGIKRIAGAAPPPPTVNAQTCNDPYVSLFGSSGPPQGGGGGGGGGNGGGGTGGTGGGSTGTTSPSGGPGPSLSGNGSSGGGSQGSGPSATAHHSGSRASKSANRSSGQGSNPTGTGSRSQQSNATIAAEQSVGLDLFRRGAQLSTVPRPVAPMLLISFGFLFLLAVPPSVAWIRSRRRRQTREA